MDDGPRLSAKALAVLAGVLVFVGAGCATGSQYALKPTVPVATSSEDTKEPTAPLSFEDQVRAQLLDNPKMQKYFKEDHWYLDAFTVSTSSRETVVAFSLIPGMPSYHNASGTPRILVEGGRVYSVSKNILLTEKPWPDQSDADQKLRANQGTDIGMLGIWVVSSGTDPIVSQSIAMPSGSDYTKFQSVTAVPINKTKQYQIVGEASNGDICTWHSTVTFTPTSGLIHASVLTTTCPNLKGLPIN